MVEVVAGLAGLAGLEVAGVVLGVVPAAVTVVLDVVSLVGFARVVAFLPSSSGITLLSSTGSMTRRLVTRRVLVVVALLVATVAADGLVVFVPCS